MSDSQNPEQQLQSTLKNISVGGNLTTGDISQILNLFVIVHQPNTYIPKSTPYNIPSSNTIKFVGRADTLEQVHQALQQNSQVAITAIEGMGGVGKTELATQYSLLHLLLNTYPGGICWLRARDEDTISRSKRIMPALGLFTFSFELSWKVCTETKNFFSRNTTKTGRERITTSSFGCK